MRQAARGQEQAAAETPTLPSIKVTRMRSKEQLKQDVLDAIRRHHDTIVSLARTVWENPESGYREFKTAELAEKTLRQHGYQPATGLSLTGLRADLDGAMPGPTLAVLGELDALVMPTHPACDPKTGAVHACGHHSHITAMLGAAIALREAGAQDSLAGRVAFIATPAEECIELAYRDQLLREGRIHALGGKASLILEGVFDDVDMAIMNHAGGGYGAADHNGFCIKNVTFRGRASHAAYPGDSQNALSAATLALSALAMLREKFAVEPSVRMHGIIAGGGTSVNIIPDAVTLEYQLRASTIEVVARLSEAFDRAVTGCAAALGCTADIDSYAGYYPLHNDHLLGDAYASVVHGLRPDWSAHVPCGFSHGCTDMGDVSAIMPALHGTCAGSAGGGHTVNYHVADEEKAYIENTQILALMCVELLADDARLGRVVAAHKADCLSVEQYRQSLARFSYHKKG